MIRFAHIPWTVMSFIISIISIADVVDEQVECGRGIISLHSKAGGSTIIFHIFVHPVLFQNCCRHGCCFVHEIMDVLVSIDRWGYVALEVLFQ